MSARSMSVPYAVVLARAEDIPQLGDIELAAARLLVGYAPESVLQVTTSEPEFRAALDAGQLWVALTGETPVGFAHVKVLERRTAHLDELDVHPDHGRRGVGRSLVQTVCDWAASRGFDGVTLSTFRSPPWNAPFYASMGFRPLDAASLTPALRQIVDDEVRRGLDVTTRVVMRWDAPRASG